MALAERREFYTDSTVQGEEAGFSKNRTSSTAQNRLLENGDFPDEEVWTKLLLSTAFKINNEDRAKATGEVGYTQTPTTGGADRVLGGLTTVATNTEAKAFDDGSTSEYTRGIRPSQNNEVRTGDDQTVDIFNQVYTGSIVDITNAAIGTDPRNIYTPRMTPAFIAYFTALVESMVTPVGAVQTYDGTKTQLNGSGTRWLILQGETIGNTGSGAVYAGDQFRDLYIHLSIRNGLSQGAAETNFSNGTTLVLSDMRGKFARGQGSFTDGGVTYTSGDLGEAQLDSIQEHTHVLNTRANGATTGVANVVTTDTATAGATGAVSATGRTSTETRPVNQALNFIIKY